MSSRGNDSAFQRALARFKGHLSPAKQKDFSITSLRDVQETIAQIQNAQGSERKMRNLTRVRAFVEAMEEFGKIIEVFLNVSEIIAFVWGPLKFLLQTASTWVESFDVLLDAYEEISENLPQLKEYGELFKQHSHMRNLLEMIYGDILEFHKRALKFFSRPTWKQLFHSSWKTFRTQFQYILSSLSRHKGLIESQASLAEYEQSKAARLSAQNSFQDIVMAERSRRFLAVTEKVHPPNTLTDHERATEIRQEFPGSGRWILGHRFLRDWKDFTCANITALWIHGIPGAGKTVIASLIIEEINHLDSVDVAYFYCKYSDGQKNSLTSVLRGILVQLVQQNEDLLSYVYDACCSSSEVTMDSPSRLKHLVETSLRSCSNACIIIDGVDECEETEEKKILAWFLATCENVKKDNEGAIRLLFISQRDKVAENLLAQASVISLDSKYHQEDIQTYARHWSKMLQPKFGISEQEASEIGTTVATQAEGQFLFAKLVFTHLYGQTTRGKLYAELQPDYFPAGLDAAYERIALRIFENANQSEREDAHNILKWIVCAKRPLKWSDIQSVFAIDSGLHRVDFDERQLRVTCRELCGPLVEIGAGDTLELVHKSAKLYLLETARISVRTEDLRIAEFCLQYLNFGCFDVALTDLEIRAFLRQKYYSFEDYAVAYWLDHVHSSTSQPLPLEAIEYEPLAQTIRSFLFKHGLDSPPDFSASTDPSFQSIRKWDFTNILDGLAHLARQRQSNEKYLDLEVQLQRRRLIYEDIVANNHPHDEAVREKLMLSASGWFKCPRKHCDSFFDGFLDKECRDKHLNEHERPFRCSLEGCLHARLGYATEKDLKRHGKMSHSTGRNSEWAFPTYKPPKKDVTLFSAAKDGDLATIKQLVGEGADVSQTTRPKGGITALVLAMKHNHTNIADFLLKKKLPLDTRWAIDNAVKYNRSAILKIILEMQATPTTRRNCAITALYYAAMYNQQNVLPLLLSCGVNIDSFVAKSAVANAKEFRRDSFVQLLLEHAALNETAESEQPPTPNPATPITPRHPSSFASPEIDLDAAAAAAQQQQQIQNMQRQAQLAIQQQPQPQPSASSSLQPSVFESWNENSHSLPFNGDLVFSLQWTK